MESVYHAMDCTADELEQFIKFIYTGKLEGFVSYALMHLAAKYEIKTLKDLCQSAFQDSYAFTRDKLVFHQKEAVSSRARDDGRKLPIKKTIKQST